ncbi:hypothetical protein ABZX12_11005 [Kribbella sp. NPDC003505]|uniref:hypothetical protein n=1 Tax=Kribbella sp. NPDC003505 TaxID=3154448 RepID=UPI0033A5571F
MPIDQHLLLAFLLTTTIAMITPGPDIVVRPRLRHAQRPAGRPAGDSRGGDE